MAEPKKKGGKKKERKIVPAGTAYVLASFNNTVVTMATPQGALAAIQALNGKDVGARILTVKEAPARSIH